MNLGSTLWCLTSFFLLFKKFTHYNIFYSYNYLCSIIHFYFLLTEFIAAAFLQKYIIYLDSLQLLQHYCYSQLILIFFLFSDCPLNLLYFDAYWTSLYMHFLLQNATIFGAKHHDSRFTRTFIKVWKKNNCALFPFQ